MNGLRASWVRLNMENADLKSFSSRRGNGDARLAKLESGASRNLGALASRQVRTLRPRTSRNGTRLCPVRSNRGLSTWIRQSLSVIADPSYPNGDVSRLRARSSDHSARRYRLGRGPRERRSVPVLHSAGVEVVGAGIRPVGHRPLPGAVVGVSVRRAYRLLTFRRRIERTRHGRLCSGGRLRRLRRVPEDDLRGVVRQDPPGIRADAGFPRGALHIVSCHAASCPACQAHPRCLGGGAAGQPRRLRR